MTLRKRQLELVHWVDSHSNGGVWSDPNTVADEMPMSRIISLGWVIHEDDERLILSSSHDDNWVQVGEVLAIVKVAITSRRPVHVGETPDGQVVTVPLKAVGEK